MANFIRITPFMHVADLDAAVKFFTEILGFKAWIHVSNSYAYVQREIAAVRILKASTSPGEEQRPGTRAFRYYIDVEDVDALVAELDPKLKATGLPAGHGPVNQSHGQREYMVLAPDGDLIVFGQSIFDMPTLIK
jgi:catechol 2,3-dioxygenase-like lactoylglutathione lyase family enzyme